MISVESEKCVGCGDCVEVCPQQVFTLGEGGKSLRAFPERCMECGACRLNCPAEAISMEVGSGCVVLITKELIFGKDAVANGRGC